jgi:N-methylhydantoinase B
MTPVTPPNSPAAEIDPVTLEVIRNGLPAISNEMAADLQRTSYNMMIYEVGDYSCTLVDGDGLLLSQNGGGVSHFIADMGVVIRDGVAKHAEDGFAPGDVVATNHQAVAGQHLNNVVVYTPFFHEGTLIGFPSVRAHWVDIGGLSTGFAVRGAVNDPWAEGLQLDQVKLYEAGEPDRKMLKMIADNIRFPQAAMGDLRSQVAACRLAERRLAALYGRYGQETIVRAIRIIFAETERRCRAIIERIPDGVYEAENHLGDPDNKSNPFVRIHARVTISGSDMEIDFSGCESQRPDTMNARTLAAAYIAYKALTLPTDPVNEGSFAALRTVIPEGNIMMARFPAAMASWSSILPAAVEAVFKALAPVIPDRIPAGHLGAMPIARWFSGHDSRRNKPFILQTMEGGGWGGRPTEDGPSASVTVCQGDVRNAPIESMELKTPVLIEERGLLPDSGGPGKFRGGLGLRFQVRALDPGMWGMAPHRRAHFPPWALGGGKPGRGGRNLVRGAGEREWKDAGAGRADTPRDAVVRIETTGGGGWGDPLDRDPRLVLDDVLDGYVSRQSAADEYGVVLAGDELDEAATERRRAELRAKA